MPDETKKSRWDYLGKFPCISQDIPLKEMLTCENRCKDCKWYKLTPSEATLEMICLRYGEKGFSSDRLIPEKCIGKVEKKY